MKLTTNELISAIDGRPGGNPEDSKITGISTDSRTISEGEVFFAINGVSYDGHNFLNQVRQKGGLFSVVERKIGKNIVLVKDTKKALLQLARFYRRRFTPLTIAITGSNGKTTTKYLVNLVLKKKFKTLMAPKSFNNEIGVPLTLFNLTTEHEVLVLELGTNHKGEIRVLSEIVQPDIGITTNIGPAHIGNFSSLEEILSEELEVSSFSKTVLLNGDDRMHRDVLIEGKRVIRFGLKNGDVRAEDIEITEDGSRFRVDDDRFFIPLFGRHNIYNALVAIIIGDILEVEREETLSALKEATPIKGRDAIIHTSGITLIDSSYNSNPAALLAMLEAMKGLKGRKIAVLGDMLELGEKAEFFHQEIGKKLPQFGIKALFTYGEIAKLFGDKVYPTFSYNNITSLILNLKDFIKKEDIILIKGSRKMKMERIVE
ncbi:UDP-N-acetylmuramoyl-tripeptide--D-alanyl-D-alanine ligase, partial [candidate division WOR-3 bacterium]|nr:UDP-N-acetylmuramoyl-tripeptide--D-alanyl-D-alanine ligase [candidate division WOR-3 bacterium]